MEDYGTFFERVLPRVGAVAAPLSVGLAVWRSDGFFIFAPLYTLVLFFISWGLLNGLEAIVSNFKGRSAS